MTAHEKTHKEQQQAALLGKPNDGKPITNSNNPTGKIIFSSVKQEHDFDELSNSQIGSQNHISEI